MVVVSTVVSALQAELQDAAFCWAVWFAVAWFWLWSSAMRNAVRWALALSGLLSLGLWISFAFQDATKSGEWTRWFLAVVFLVTMRLLVGGNDQIESRRRLRSIARRR